jgi:hypothetical protein
MRRGRPLALTLVILLCGLPGAAQEAQAPVVDEEERTVTVPATLRLRAFADGDPPGHHLVTWTEGRAGHKALLETPVADVAVLNALEALGGKPGDTLNAEAWTERANPAHPAPDVKAAGSALGITVLLASGARHPISALLEDVDERGFEWRLAGNRKLIPEWRSGCVICLQSCPGSKVGNARATMRDLHRGRSRFRASKLAKSLGEGAKLWVTLRLKAKPE